MRDQPDRAPATRWDGAVRLACATVAMTCAAVAGAAILAAVAVATENPEALLIGAIIAVLAAGGVANLLARIIRP